jgi:hypothetical protein
MWDHAELAEDMAIDELAFDFTTLSNNDLTMLHRFSTKKERKPIEAEIQKRNFICKCWHKLVKSKKWTYYCNNLCFIRSK